MLYRDIVYDLWSDLKQVYDDADISLYSVIYWVSVHADKLKSQHIEKRSSGAFLTQYPQVPVEADVITNYKYITIPETVYDFNNDKGIDYISFDYTLDEYTPPFTSVTFTRTTPTQAKLLYWTQEETPKPDNPYWYRIKDKIYLLGIESIDVQNVEVGLYTAFNPRNIVDLDTECEFPQELIAILIRQVMDLGRFVLMMPTDKLNDGTTDSAGTPKTKLLSVNDPNSVQQNQNQQQTE